MLGKRKFSSNIDDLLDAVSRVLPSLSSKSSFSLFDHIREFNPLSVYALYNWFNWQCSSCGFRAMKGSPIVDSHYDWHFRTQQAASTVCSSGKSRLWFVTEDDWIRGCDNNKNDEKNDTNDGEIDENDVVSTDDPEQFSFCSVCFQSFEVLWDSATELWVYPDTTRLDSGVIVHKVCLQ